MKTAARIAIVVLLTALAVWLWGVVFPSPQKIIIGEFRKLAQSASVHPGEGYVPRLLGAQTVGGYFATNVELNVELPGRFRQTMLSREDIVQALMGAQLSGGLTVRFQDISVTVSSDNQTAQADMTVEAQMPGQDLIVQQMDFTLRKIEGKWLIARVKTVRTFS